MIRDPPISCTLRIWDGDGLFSTLLDSQEVSFLTGTAWRSFDLSTPVSVVASNSYTVELLGSQPTGTFAVRYLNYDLFTNSVCYVDGTAVPTADMAIQAWVIPVTVSWNDFSTEDYTTAEKAKLAGIAEGAEANENADWNAISGDAQILNKPSLGTLAAQSADAVNITGGTGVYSSLKVSATNNALTLSCLTTTQRDAFTPTEGMLLYNTTTKKFQGYGLVKGSAETNVLIQSDDTFWQVIGNEWRYSAAQLFTLSEVGVLTKVGFKCRSLNGEAINNALALNIWGGGGGFTNLLSTQAITIPASSTPAWVSYSLATPIESNVSGQSYIMEITYANVGNILYVSSVDGRSPNGKLFINQTLQTSYDMAFQVWMTVDRPGWVDLH